MKINKAGGGFGATKRHSITFLFGWNKIRSNYSELTPARHGLSSQMPAAGLSTRGLRLCPESLQGKFHKTHNSETRVGLRGTEQRWNKLQSH